MQTRAGVVEKAPKTLAGVRSIEAPERLIPRLAAHKAAQSAARRAAGLPWSEADFVFADELGRPFAPDTASRWLSRLKREAGWPTRVKGLHGLRHYFGTTLARGGMPIRDLADALGHADPAFTLRTYVARKEGVIPTSKYFAAPRFAAGEACADRRAGAG